MSGVHVVLSSLGLGVILPPKALDGLLGGAARVRSRSFPGSSGRGISFLELVGSARTA